MDSETDDEFDIKAYSRRRNITSVSSILKDVIQKCEKTKPQKINVIALANQHQGNHRRLYELFNILTYFGVTKTVGRGKLCWVGFSSMHSHLEKTYMTIEERGLTESINDIFVFKEVPSLGQVAELFISLFPFLGVTTLDIKIVTQIFSMKIPDKKSCERKIYLALSLLETIGCIEHHPRSGNYKILLDIKKLLEKSQKHIFSLESKNPYSIANLLNRSYATYMSAQHYERQRDFQLLANSYNAIS